MAKNYRETRRLASLGKKLTASQRKAAEMLALPEIYGKKSAEDIAKVVGVSMSSIYRWRQDEDFIEYKNAVADQAMDEFLSEAYDMLRTLARGARTDTNKLKALELSLKNRGKLNDVMKLDATVDDRRSDEAIDEDIERMERELREMEQRESQDED
jgi:transcriptional regulator with XRE-family HTH domain